MKNFKKPETAREARERIAKLVEEIMNIESQLADKNKKDTNGRRMHPRKYMAWRKNAISALSFKSAELQAARSWLRDYTHGILSHAMDLDSSDPMELLKACYVAHENIKGIVGVEELPPEIIIVFDLVRDKVLGVAG